VACTIVWVSHPCCTQLCVRRYIRRSRNSLVGDTRYVACDQNPRLQPRTTSTTRTNGYKVIVRHMTDPAKVVVAQYFVFVKRGIFRIFYWYRYFTKNTIKAIELFKTGWLILPVNTPLLCSESRKLYNEILFLIFSVI